jgi:hypothetical protein
MVSLSYKEYLRLTSIADIVALNKIKGHPALANSSSEGSGYGVWFAFLVSQGTRTSRKLRW